MKPRPTDVSSHNFLSALLGNDQEDEALVPRPEHAGKTIASLYACGFCDAWWAGSEEPSPAMRLLFRLVEPHSTRYLWADYRGWYHGAQALVCAHCGQPTAAAAFALRRDARGQIIWPQEAAAEEPVPVEAAPLEQEANPFLAYVTGSAAMGEAMAAIAAREAKREVHAWGYTANIEALRDEMAAQQAAFKHVVAGYAPLLPPGWRITADYDKWLQGKACAGFLHGEVAPDISLLIGGECRTVAALELEMDRLFRYVVQRDE